MKHPALFCLVLALACASQKAAENPARVEPGKTPATAAADSEAFRKQRPAPGKAGSFEYPTPTAIDLPNGFRVLYVRRPGRVVSLTLLVRHGASSVPEGKSGLAGLVARMLSESTRQRPAMALAEAVESLGTTLSAAAGRDDSRVSMTVLPADFEPALRLLGEVVMEPAFAPRDFERVKNEWLDGVQAERQDPQRLASLTAVRALNGPVLGAPVNGSLSHVKRLGVADLKDFHARAYTPDNAALIVVGEVEEAAVRAEATRLFGSWRGKNAIARRFARDSARLPRRRGSWSSIGPTRFRPPSPQSSLSPSARPPVTKRASYSSPLSVVYSPRASTRTCVKRTPSPTAPSPARKKGATSAR